MSLREALELEAVKCAAGDARHDFQLFYPKWMDEQRAASKDLSKLGQLDAARVLEEIKMVRQAINEHEALLAEHRQAVVDCKPSPYSAKDIDAIHGTLDNMRRNLPAMEDELNKLLHRDGGKTPALTS